MKFNPNDEVWVDYSERVTTDDEQSEVRWYLGPAEIVEPLDSNEDGFYTIRPCTFVDNNGQPIEGKIIDFPIPSNRIHNRFKFKSKEANG